MTTEAIITTVAVLVACCLALGIYLVMTKHNQKRESLKRLLELDEQLKKLSSNVSKTPKQIDVLTYDEQLFKTQIELPFPMLKLEKTIVLVEVYLDFSKKKNEPAIEPKKMTLKFSKDHLSYWHNGIEENISYKNIFYLKGFYEHRRNALFISFVEYDLEHKLAMQIMNIRDLIVLSNIIKTNH